MGYAKGAALLLRRFEIPLGVGYLLLRKK